MRPRTAFSASTISPLLFVIFAGSAWADGKASRPNIILCMADDQGWGDVGYNGHPVLKTPNLDALAAAGLRFDRFYAAAPVCSPTRGSVMTGRHPNRFGCFSWGHTLRPQEQTIAEVLQAAGYATGHFGKWHLGSVQRGSPVNPGASGFDVWLSAPNFYDNEPVMSREGMAVPINAESSMVAADAALDFIRAQAKRPEPFLAVVWFGSPHSPHEASEEDRNVYADQPRKLQDFYGEITGLDRAVGKLRESLRQLGIHENTIFWYCSDNGGLPNLGMTGGRGKKADIYEGGLRVPAVLEWPGRIRRPRITAMPASTVDIFPTLLEITGTKPIDSRPLDGISLAPLIDGKMSDRPKPMGFWQHPTRGIGTPSKKWMDELLAAQKQGKELDEEVRMRRDAGKIDGKYPRDRFPGHAAWLDWPWKLHRIDQEGKEARYELYNLAEDPDEKVDRLTAQAGRFDKMRSELGRWLESVVASLNGDDYGRTYSNPIIDRIGPADPHVVKYKGKYYLYPTLDGRGYDVFVSDDLINWEQKGKCYTDRRGGLWAPDVFHNARGDGRFYLYYSADNPDGGKLIGVAVADQPLGPFVDSGTLVKDAIDAHLFQDDDGSLYLYFAQIADGCNRICVQPMSDLVTMAGEPKLLIPPTEAWETNGARITEGPFMLKRNGIYYLTYSGSPADGPNYAVGYATSQSPLGPFTRYAGNPIAHRGDGVFGPGHHCVIDGPDGQLWMVYHQQRDDQRGWKRFLAIDPMWFDEKGVLHAKTTRGTTQPAPW